jgi:hypothetical protein
VLEFGPLQCSILLVFIPIQLDPIGMPFQY